MIEAKVVLLGKRGVIDSSNNEITERIIPVINKLKLN
jgi:hypothetical protein